MGLKPSRLPVVKLPHLLQCCLIARQKLEKPHQIKLARYGYLMLDQLGKSCRKISGNSDRPSNDEERAGDSQREIETFVERELKSHLRVSRETDLTRQLI
ncbi:hypothetical protein PMIN07_001143 [Paraphaeosphaeria minitans]